MGKRKPTYGELEEELRKLKNSYKKLQESEEKYQTIFETSQDAIGISKDGITVSFNDSYLKLFGYSRKEELTGRPILEQIAPREHEKIKSYILKRKEGKDAPKFYETIGIRKNGKEFPFEINIGTYSLGNDNYNVVIIRDITQRKKAEQEIVESTDKFSAAFYKSSIGQIITSLPRGEIYDVNKALLTLTGYGKEDFLNRSTLELELWANESERDIFLKAVGKNRLLQNKEFKFRFKSGEIRDCLVSANIIKIKGDEYLLTNVIDITELKDTEEKLKESEMRWHFSVDGSGLGLWDWNMVANEVFFSTQWKKMLGFEEDEITASLEEWDKRVHPEDKENVYTDLNAHFEGKTPIYSNEHRVLCKDGKYKWILDRGKVVSRTKEGKPERVIGTHTDIDIQKRNQQIFIESVAKFKLLFEQSPVGIYIADREGNIVDGNQKLLELLGSPSLEDTKKINVLKFPPLVENGYASAFEQCIKTGKKQQIEMLYTSHWGKHSFLSSYIVPLLDAKGNILHVYTMMEDISERKKIEQELKESQQRLELFFRQSAIGFFFMMLDEPMEWNEHIDKDKALDYVFTHQKITKVNDAMLQQYAAELDDFIGLTPMDFYKDDSVKRKKLWKELFDNGKLHIDAEEKRFDGSTIIVTGDYICLYDKQNRIMGHFGALSDVTAEREAQKALKVSEEKFKNIIESANDWIWEVDASGKYTYASPQVSVILGYQADEIIGKTPFDFMPEQERNRLTDVFYDLVTNGKPISNLENINNHKEGHPVVLETSGMPFFDSENNLLGYRGIDRDITEKKKRVIALRESEELLKTAQNIAKLGYWSLDLVNDKLTWSDQTYQIFGLDPKTFIPSFDKFLELIHTEDRDRVSKAYNNSLIKKEDYNIDHRITLKNGEIKYVSEHCNTVFDDNGKPVKSIGTIQDITRIKENEKNLLDAKSEIEKSNVRLNEAQRLAMLGSWSYSFITRKMEWSDEIFNIFEINRKDKTPDIDFFIATVHPSDKNQMSLEIDKAKETGQAFDITHRICLKNNKVKYIRQRGRYEYDDTGTAVFFSGTIQDVTKERKLQAELVKSEVLKKTILASQPILIWAKDTEGRFIACNPQFERLFGAKEADILGKTDYDFVDKDLADWFRKHDKNAMKAGESLVNEEWVTYPDNGERVLLETTKTPLRDELGTIFGVLGVAYDITKRTEREDILREAKQEAERANRLKSEFLANLSHEIRTPMNAVVGYSEILAKKLKNNPEYLSYIEGINRSGKNLLTLINDILDLSKIEAGKLDIVPVPVDLKKILHDIKQIFAANITLKHLDFTLYTDEQLPGALMLDKTRIRQVLFNLVGNAIKFTEKGSVTISVGIEKMTSAKSKIDLYLEVEDTGIGIPKQQLTEIFKAFRQAHGQLSKFEGTGLGLAISKRLVEAMGGTISAESKSGKGSKFRVHLKNVIIPSSESIKKLKESKTATQGVVFKHPTILLVDDVESNLEVIREQLVELGCNVKLARNGKEAIKLLKKQKPDLIIMDIQMPVLDGYEATKIIKADTGLRPVPVIALTALAMKEQKDKYKDLFDDYLKKPIVISKLVVSLMKFLPWEKDQEDVVKDIGIEWPDKLPAKCTAVLKAELFPMFNELKDFFDTEESQLFIGRLSEIAGNYDLPVFKDFGKQLNDATNKMQMNRINQLLSSFDVFKNSIS